MRLDCSRRAIAVTAGIVVTVIRIFHHFLSNILPEGGRRLASNDGGIHREAPDGTLRGRAETAISPEKEDHGGDEEFQNGRRNHTPNHGSSDAFRHGGRACVVEPI
jgi:hypothetical protein